MDNKLHNSLTMYVTLDKNIDEISKEYFDINLVW